MDSLGPAFGFFTPGLGRSTTRDWHISGAHMAERCKLFLIIALGESILVTGATFGESDFTPAALAAFIVAFLGSVALWWVYFDLSFDAAERAFESSSDPGRLGRFAYTYLHIPMVAGIIVTAVGDELVIAHPFGHATPDIVATVLGGPALVPGGTPAVQASGVRRLVDLSPGGDRDPGHRCGDWERLGATGAVDRGAARHRGGLLAGYSDPSQQRDRGRHEA